MSQQKKFSRSIRHVLVIFPGALGDLMCLMPAVGAISRRHPGASVELMARPELARLVVGRTVFERGHSIDAREVSALFTDEPSDKAREFFSRFDRIYSFFASDDRRFRARLAAATDGEVSFHPFRPSGDGHIAAAYLREIGDGDAPMEMRLEPTAEDLAEAARVLARAGCGCSNPIVIFPGSGSPAKNWPAEKFAVLAQMPASESGRATGRGYAKGTRDAPRRQLRRSVVVLGPAEASMEPVFRGAGAAVLKKLDLATVAAVARMAAAFVGNDSGVSHLAAAVGTAGVVIFGPTDPARWRPLGAGGRIEVVRREPLDSIEPREVAAALAKFSKFVASAQR